MLRDTTAANHQLIRNEFYRSALQQNVSINVLGFKEVEYPFFSSKSLQKGILRAVIPSNSQLSILKTLEKRPHSASQVSSKRIVASTSDTTVSDAFATTATTANNATDRTINTSSAKKVRPKSSTNPHYLNPVKRFLDWEKRQREIEREEERARQRRQQTSNLIDAGGNEYLYDYSGKKISKKNFESQQEKFRISQNRLKESPKKPIDPSAPIFRGDIWLKTELQMESIKMQVEEVRMTSNVVLVVFPFC